MNESLRKATNDIKEGKKNSKGKEGSDEQGNEGTEEVRLLLRLRTDRGQRLDAQPAGRKGRCRAAGRDLDTAIKRELKEELGVDVED